ncbi:MAG: PIN domain-containing protein [Chloroflexi bacterium]|nr:PIN domain-containing protein [Chloroflexota bacterium]
MAPVIVDTSAWVQYFRVPDSSDGDEVERLISDGEVVMVGVVYTELLQGARSEEEFITVEEKLDALPFLEAGKETWRQAGRLLQYLRRQGQIIPLADALIAVLALEGNHQVFTMDNHFQRVPGLRLYEAKA